MTKKPTPATALEIFVSAELKKFEFTNETLQKKVDAYKDLTITDLADKEGLRKVHEARMDLKNTRVHIEKTGKGLRESANTFNKSILARQGELVNIISPTEGSLTDKEDLYDKWKEEERMEAERQEAVRLDDRIKKLRAVDADHDIVALKLMPDESFLDILEEATKAFTDRKLKEKEEQAAREKEQERIDREFKAEQARVKREAAEQEAERTRLQEAIDKMNQEKAELAEMRRKLEAQQKEHADNVAAEEAEKKRLADIEQARLDGEAKAKRDHEEELIRKKLDENAAVLRRAQEEAEKPDKEKVQSMVVSVTFATTSIVALKMRSAKYRALQQQTIEMLNDVLGVLQK